MRQFSTIVITVLLISCGGRDLDSLDKQVLTLGDLPEPVVEIYETEALKKNEVDYVVISTDKKFQFSHEFEGVSGGLSWLYSSHLHHFYINGKHFTMYANQGDPFVFHDKKLFYTKELNLAGYNYKEAKYIAIDLEEFVDD